MRICILMLGFKGLITHSWLLRSYLLYKHRHCFHYYSCWSRESFHQVCQCSTAMVHLQIFQKVNKCTGDTDRVRTPKVIHLKTYNVAKCESVWWEIHILTMSKLCSIESRLIWWKQMQQKQLMHHNNKNRCADHKLISPFSCPVFTTVFHCLAPVKILSNWLPACCMW